jgi:hypothetical protein
MSDQEFPRNEWAMSLDIPLRDPKREVLPCFCYELTRDWDSRCPETKTRCSLGYAGLE